MSEALVRRLAVLLFAYDMDEPHNEEPEGSGHYPLVPWQELAGYLAEPHRGDCTGLPAPCTRCYTEHILHKSRWIADRLGPEPTLAAQPQPQPAGWADDDWRA